jgi:hypothetical protein
MSHDYKLLKYLGFALLPLALSSHFANLPILAQTSVQKSIGTSVPFTCTEKESTIKLKNPPKVTFGTTTIYIGYQQVSSINKNPRLIRFDNGVKKWCRTDYETTMDDGTGYGLLWDGKGVLYGVFSATGSQIGNDFRRFAVGRWLPSYGTGGGPKVAIIARIDPNNGNVNYATFVTARKPSDGKTNSLVVKNLSWNGVNLTVSAQSWWSPRRADKTSMTCTGSSPYTYQAIFTGDLKKVTSASAVNCQ